LGFQAWGSQLSLSHLRESPVHAARAQQKEVGIDGALQPELAENHEPVVARELALCVVEV